VHPGRIAQETGTINRTEISTSALNLTRATDIGNRLTIAAEAMSTHGVITKNIMLVIRRPTEPKDTPLSTIADITDRFTNTILTAVRSFANITISVSHPTMYFLLGCRPSNRDGPSPSRPKTGGKLNKSVRRYIILKLSGSGFKVQRLQPMDTAADVNQNIAYPSYPIEPNGFTGLFR
jgi:hypothetical protein